MTEARRENERCEHGIRWPWACHECDDAAWAKHKALRAHTDRETGQ